MRRIALLVIMTLAIGSVAAKCQNGTTPATTTATAGQGQEVTIKPGEVNVGVENLKAGFTSRRFMTRSAAIPYHLEGLVGHVIYVEKRDGRCPSSTAEFYDSFEVSPDGYLKSDAKLNSATPNKVLYSNKVDKKAEATLKVVAFNAKASADLLSEVTITDVQTMSIPAGALRENWEQAVLSKFDPKTDCDVILVRGATLSVATSKDYRVAAAEGDLQGGVFAAGGKIYQELNNTNAQLLVAIDASRVRPSGKIPGWLSERVENLPAPSSSLGVPASFGQPPDVMSPPKQ